MKRRRIRPRPQDDFYRQLRVLRATVAVHQELLEQASVTLRQVSALAAAQSSLVELKSRERLRRLAERVDALEEQ